MANGAFKFKDNSGNVVAHISGSGTGIMVSGSALGLTGSVDVVGSLSVNGSPIISNYSQLTSSLDTRYVLSGSITQTTWDNIASKPSGIVSGSSQVQYSGITGAPSGLLSGSSQVQYSGITGTPSGIISSSIQESGFGYAITGSNTFQANQTINGNLIVTGSLTAQQFIVSSSVTYLTTSFASGSTKFGDDTGDNHNFTGSLYVTGALRIPTASSTSNITGTAAGQLFYNTTDNNIYRYNGSFWLSAAGSSGSSGTSGSTGASGSSGTSGSTGAAGSSGTSGSNGQAGSSGTSGSNGQAGSSGTSGTNGQAGSSGTSGSNGQAGSSGTSGTNGQAGSSGTSGSTGAAGSSGTSGAAIINNNTSTYVLTATGTAGTIQGNSGFTFNSGTVTATTFSGALSGNASTATQVTQTLTGTNAANLLYAPIADNDYARIRVGGDATNSGWMELATADDGNEPIYVRQYTGVFATVTRTATLLDGSGNTIFPGNINGLTVSGGTITSGTWNGSAIGNAYLANSSFYLGSTSISLGRASATLNLAGVNTDGYAASLNGYANQTLYTILDGPANGPVIKVRYDSATANRYIDIGSKDGNGVYSEGLKIYNGTTLTFAGYTVYHSGNVPTWNQNTTGTASNITAYTVNQSVGTGDSPTFSSVSLNGGLTINGSLSRGTYTSGSNYVTGADNIVLKGNASGVSGIFFESEKDGTNINHPSDFGFIQFFPYGIGGSSGESNRLVIGVSNDADDLIVMNPVDINGLKLRVGVGTTEYTIYHSGNVPTWNQNTTGTASNITTYTINQSVGTGNAPTFAGGTINGSLYVNANNDITTLAGSLTLYSSGNATTSMIMFKNTTGLGYGNHGAITGGYNTYFVMDTTDRGWVWRNATTSTNIASISNTGTITANGNIMPTTNNSSNLGSASVGWANVYTNDLHLSNMNKPEGNDIDGTNGTWTIQEGVENLYIINNNNGKKFKISLEEVK
jgi:hypothetical protein